MLNLNCYGNSNLPILLLSKNSVFSKGGRFRESYPEEQISLVCFNFTSLFSIHFICRFALRKHYSFSRQQFFLHLRWQFLTRSAHFITTMALSFAASIRDLGFDATKLNFHFVAGTCHPESMTFNITSFGEKQQNSETPETLLHLT